MLHAEAVRIELLAVIAHAKDISNTESVWTKLERLSEDAGGRKNLMEDILSVGLRPCIVTHKVKGKLVEKKAIFHCWTVSKVDENLIQTLALVEYEDGSLAQVKLKCLRFTDGIVRYFYEVMENYEEDTEE